MDVRIGPKRKLSTEELMFLNWVLEKTLESPLDSKNKPVHPKGNQPWIFIRRADAEAETPKLWPPDVKNWLTGEERDVEKYLRQEKGTTEDEMVGMASPTQWTWVWTSSGGCWWTGKPGMLQSMGLQRVRHDWVTEVNCTKWPGGMKSPGHPIFGSEHGHSEMEWLTSSRRGVHWSTAQWGEKNLSSPSLT